MLSLYEICLEILADSATYVTDFNHVPFHPYIEGLLQAIYNKPHDRLRFDVLEKIGRAHGTKLRESNSPFCTVDLCKKVGLSSPLRAFENVSRSFPHFVCKLNLAHCSDINDSSILYLKEFINLQVLDLTGTNISDAAVASISRMAGIEQKHYGLRNIQVVSFAANNSITDRSLKHIVRIKSLLGVDLSLTGVTDVAIRFLNRYAYESVSAVPLNLRTKSKLALQMSYTEYRGHESSLVSWESTAPTSKIETIGKDKVANPGYHIPPNPALTRLVIATTKPLEALDKGPAIRTFTDPDLDFQTYAQLCFARSSRQTTHMDARSNVSERKVKRHRTAEQRTAMPSLGSMQNYLTIIEKDMGLSL